jgi:hypothetical protein
VTAAWFYPRCIIIRQKQSLFAPPVTHIAHGARPAREGEHGAGEHRVERELAAGGGAGIGDLAQRGGEAGGGLRRHGELAEGAGLFAGEWLQGIAQARAGVGPKRTQPEALGMLVRDVVIVAVAAEAGGLAGFDPAGRLVTGSRIPLGIDEGFGE